MISNALIDPTNRLLGWSINDFSLYGGQVAVTIGAPAAPRLSDGLSVRDPHLSSASRTAQAEGSPAQAEAAQTLGEPLSEAPGNFHFTPFAPAPIQFGDPTHATAFDVQVPTATGSGTAILTVEAFHAPVTMPTALPTGLTPPTLSLEEPAIAAPAPVALGGLAAPILESSQTLDHLVSSVATATDTLLDDTQQAIDALPQVSEIIAADGFLGNDPVAGVATLVSMVDSTDAFDLAHAGVDVPEVAAAGSILDTLADEAVAGPLLGDVEHGVDTLLPDHQHDGVPGLL